jgi:hypothetical protein
MPKLHIFALCEKVIEDREGTASLISLFDQISAHILPGTKQIPPNAVAPKEWCAFTSWKIEPEDVGREYRQFIQLLYPNGEQFGQALHFSFTPQADKTHQQVSINGLGFPVGQEGLYTLKMWLEHNGSVIFESPPIIIKVNYQKMSELPPDVLTIP